MRTPAVLWTLLALQVLDLQTTALGRRLGEPEGNPVIDWLLDFGGYAGFALAKVMVVLVAALMLNMSWRGVGPWAVHAANSIYAFVVASNLFAVLGLPDWSEWVVGAAFAALVPLVPRAVVPALPAPERVVDAVVRTTPYSSA